MSKSDHARRRSRIACWAVAAPAHKGQGHRAWSAQRIAADLGDDGTQKSFGLILQSVPQTFVGSKIDASVR
jgi:hypothetical protein